MAHRQPAARVEPEEQAAAARVQHFRVGAMFWPIVVFLVPLALGSFGVAAYAAALVDIECTRAAGSMEATCTVVERYHFETTVTSGPLHAPTLSRVEHEDLPDEYLLDLGPNYPRAGTDERWAKRTLEEAKAFFEDHTRTRWEAHYRTPYRVLGLVLLGVLLLVFAASQEAWLGVEIDASSRELRTRARRILGPRRARTVSLRGVDVARLDAVDDSDAPALVLLRGGVPEKALQGDRETLKLVATAINIVLRDAYDDGDAMPAELRAALIAADAQPGRQATASARR